jgi:hypothetical protein
MCATLRLHRLSVSNADAKPQAEISILTSRPPDNVHPTLSAFNAPARFLTYPTVLREGEHVVIENRLAFEQLQSILAKPPSICDDHPVATTVRHIDLGGNRVRLAKQESSVRRRLECRAKHPST